ncbi:aldo/keto reductase [Streptomyces millisiae]|uniref:Aldo/keto reductase n=1 Tax=Streptomyces millisiae TaxID=3075542 RepID=A0ABU2LMH9_9ACTN|nr:aldo/keto reductase [Streptomyces sp. DSM 44918]MDT0318810.1 aldo/keto reductase [Streptomyces sp. DSM 44918]
MRLVTLGELEVSALGLGAMGLTEYAPGGAEDEAEAVRAVHRALDLGVNHIDTAEVYGPYDNEGLLGRALRGRRDEVVLASKFGILSHTGHGPVDGRRANVRLALEGSLRRLGTDHVDLYYQHGEDPDVPVEETVGALAELVGEGKIRAVGLCEVRADTIRRAHAVHPLAAVQTEYSLWTRGAEAWLLPLLRDLGIAPVCAAPLGHGFLTGRIRAPEYFAHRDRRRHNPRFSAENLPHNLRIADELAAVAEELDATPAQVALAWLLAHGSDITAVPGARRAEFVTENVAAARLALPHPQMARLNRLPAPAGAPLTDTRAWRFGH